MCPQSKKYWSEIATFSYPLAFNAPVGDVPIGIPGKSLDLRKLESWLPDSEDSLTIGRAVLTQYHAACDGRRTDRRTDRTAYSYNVRGHNKILTTVFLCGPPTKRSHYTLHPVFRPSVPSLASLLL